MPRVLFTRRSGAYWPGASPVLEDDVVARLLKDGTAVPYTESTMKKISEAQAKGAEFTPPGNTKNQPVINVTGEPVPTEYEPKLRGTSGPLKAIGKTDADKEDDAALAEADKAAEKTAPAKVATTKTAKKSAAKPKTAKAAKASAKAVKSAADAANKAIERDTK
jgi:hypothetical protein